MTYAAVSLAFFGGPILRDPLHTYLGTGVTTVAGYTDPSFYMWNFVWWPHSIAQGMNPLVSHIVWAPDGFSLASAQTAPGLSLILSPITSGLGPVATYNVVMLLAPALGAWAAYLLCWRLTRSFWPSVAGGYFFGFSSYELAHLTDHPNLAMTFLVPLAAYLVVRRLDGSLPPRPFLILLIIVLVVQFSISPEIFLTMTMFGVLVGVLAAWRHRRDQRSRVPSEAVAVVRSIAGAYAIACLLVAPYLVYAFSRGLPQLPQSWPFGYKTDLANILVPTRLHRLGGSLMGSISDRFTAPVDESGAYAGTILVVVVLFALQRSRALLHRILIWFLGLSVLASLGPTLTIAGTRLVVLPWVLFAFLPIVKMALPARFMLYAWLAVAAIVSLWLAQPSKRRSAKWILVVGSAILLIPNTSLPYWRNKPPVPRFFSEGSYRSYLRQGENALVIPYGGSGFSMLWQATSGMWFTMPEGRLCPMPESFQTWPIMRTFYGSPLTASYKQDLEQFLAAKSVQKIVVVTGTPGEWRRLFSTLGVKPDQVADVLIYRVPARILTAHPADGAGRPILEDLRGDCG